MPLESLSDIVTRRVGNDQLGASALAVDDGVLAEGAAEIDRLFAVDAVDEPGRLPPDAFGLRLEPDEDRLYRVAWVGGCVLYDTAKLREAGGFEFWCEGINKYSLPSHCSLLTAQRTIR